MLPVSIAGGVAVIAAVAITVAVVIRPAGVDPVAASPSPTTSDRVSASPSAAPERPAPRIRIDCESVIPLAQARGYVGDGAKLSRLGADDVESVAFLQAGGLGCRWTDGQARLDLMAIPIDVAPDSLSRAPDSEGRDPLIDYDLLGDSSAVYCYPPQAGQETRCFVTAVGDAVRVEVTSSLPVLASDADQATLGALLKPAVAKVLAARTLAAPWMPAYAVTAIPRGCVALDPSGLLGEHVEGDAENSGFMTESDAVWAALESEGAVSCLFSRANFSVIPGSQWAWNDLAAVELSRGAEEVAVDGADAALLRCRPAAEGAEQDCWITAMSGGSVFEFSGLPAAADDLVGIVGSWLSSR